MSNTLSVCPSMFVISCLLLISTGLFFNFLLYHAIRDPVSRLRGASDHPMSQMARFVASSCTHEMIMSPMSPTNLS